MNHLTARLDVVVTAVDLDQPGVGAQAVHVIVQASVLGHNAVLRGIFELRIEHLAVIGEGIAALRHETVGLGDPVAAAVDDLAARLDVVVSAVDLDQSGVGAQSVHVIVQAAVLGHDAVLRGIFGLRIEHLAVIVKGVAALGHETVGLGDPVAAAMNHLTARLDVVVAAVDLDQAGVGAQAVLVIVQAAVLRHDAVLRGIFGLRIEHPAVIGEGVAALRHETVGLRDPVAAAMNHLAARLDVVVSAVDLDQAGVGAHAVLVVVQAAVFRHDALFLQEELAVRIEGIEALLEAAVTHPLAVILPAGHQLAAASGVVIAAVQLEHTHVHADAVDVVVLGITFRDNAVLELLVMRDHTVFIEVVAPLRQQAVGLVRRNPEVVSACGQDVLHGLTVRAKVVVQIMPLCVLDLRQTLVLYDLAILQPIGIIAIDAQAVFADWAELSRVCDIAGNCGELLVPSGKLVAVIRGLRLDRRPVVGRHLSVVHRGGFQHSAVITLPGHSIGIDFPTGLEGQIRVEEQRASTKIQLRSRLLRNLKRIIIREFSDRTGDEPAVKCVALAGEVARRERVRLTIKLFYRCHRTGSAVGFKGNDRILRPLRVQCCVRIEIHGRPVSIGSAAAIRLRVPTGKGIVRAGEGVGGQRIVKAGVDTHGIHGARAAVGVEVDGDLASLDHPFTVGIHIGVARLGRSRLGVGTVGVVQLGGGDGDSHRCYFRFPA